MTKNYINMESGKFLMGLFAGIAVGAVAGILFAPDKGSATRKKILKNAEGYTDNFRYKYYELLDKMKEQATEKIEDGKEFVQNGQNKYEDYKKDLKSATQNI